MTETNKLPEPDAERFHIVPFSNYDIVTVDGIEVAQSVIDSNCQYELTSLLTILEKLKQRSFNIYCELGPIHFHKTNESGKTFQRAVEVNLNNVAAVIDPKSLAFVNDAGRLTITGRVKVLNPTVKSLIENGEAMFGIRALTDNDSSSEGVPQIRKIRSIITWDLVPANKDIKLPVIGETL